MFYCLVCKVVHFQPVEYIDDGKREPTKPYPIRELAEFGVVDSKQMFCSRCQAISPMAPIKI